MKVIDEPTPLTLIPISICHQPYITGKSSKANSDCNYDKLERLTCNCFCPSLMLVCKVTVRCYKAPKMLHLVKPLNYPQMLD